MPDAGSSGPNVAAVVVDDRPDVDELIAEYEAERPARALSGPLANAVGAVAAGLSVYVLYRVFAVDNGQHNRMIFLAVVLPLTFLVYRPGFRRRGERLAQRGHDHPGVADYVLAGLALVTSAYPAFTFDQIIVRTVTPTRLDLVMGGTLLLLVIEATRRTTGWALPVVSSLFLLYAYYSGYLPISWVISTPGFGIDRIIEHLYITTEGIYGTPLDVAATYIVLFTIYGAVLDLSGASKFFVDLSFAAFRKSRTAAGRTVTLAGFLLGTVSGSGTATAVSIGSVSWPILRRAGYPRDQAGGIIAAAGIGAILSPPTLGAAAFIIAEYMRINYLTVLLYATVPTLLYYLGIVLAIEIDARRLGTRPVELAGASAWQLMGRYFYHFSSLLAIVVFMSLNLSPFTAVTYATALAFLLSFADRKAMLTPQRAYKALAQGTLSVLPVAATCASAGIIVGIVTLSGLGLNLSDIVVGFADVMSWNYTSQLVLTVVLAAAAILLLGLAVPVTASFIIAAVIIKPIFEKFGIGEAESYMFIFYYAVLSEVSPPTALAAVATSAITGGNPYRTMMQAWRYTLPAFLVPFHFVLAPAGRGVLGLGSLPEVVAATVISCIGVAALAVVTGAWLVGPTRMPERVLAGISAVLLLWVAPVPDVLGLVAAAAAIVLHIMGRRPAILTAAHLPQPERSG
ncbi:MAG: TRAP transporter fused permease subunit [Actinobacteria bacterium]|nr:TRAP transporter fused permease subunit [Actinomycetota bacterium]MBI3687806.1 TRAP transporter fused permease subunit [Actinomycetota bacterium]